MDTNLRFRLVIMVRAAAFGLVGCLSTAFLFNQASDNLFAYLFWTCLFVVGLTLLARYVVMNWFSVLPARWCYVLSVPIGLTYAFLTVMLTAFLLGPWFLAFDIPVFPTWVVGGASGLVACAGLGSRRHHAHTGAELIMLVLLSLVTVIAVNLFIRPGLGYRLVTATCVRWQHGSEPTQIVDRHGLLTDAEIARLKALNLGGVLTVTGTGGGGSGPRSHGVVVMQRQESAEVKLPLPGDTDIIYVQYDNGWQRSPADAPTLRRGGLWVEPLPNDPAGDFTLIRPETPQGKGMACSVRWS